MTRISHLRSRPPLAMLAFELLHIGDELAHAFDRHGVVDRGAHAANRAMSLELREVALRRALEERVVERLVFQRERHVHARAVLLRRSEERRVGKECRSRWARYH